MIITYTYTHIHTYNTYIGICLTMIMTDLHAQLLGDLTLTLTTLISIRAMGNVPIVQHDHIPEQNH